MSEFLMAAIALAALTTGIVVKPLWRDFRGLALGLLLGLPAMTALLYLQLGTPDALDARNVVAPETFEDAIEQLERRLVREPGEVQGWLLLGRSRAAQGQYPQAQQAFAKAHALLPNDLDVMVEYADAQLRAASDGRFPDEARTLLERVINENPQHQRGLFLLGMQRLHSGRAAEAVALWDTLLPLLEPDTAEAFRPQLDAAREQAGLPASPSAPEASPAEGPTLRITVEVADELLERIPDSATLYVFARSVDGSNLPVAVKRLPATGFPLELTLSDADGLMPTQKLSAQASVRLLARISLSGDAAPGPGDFEAKPLEISVQDSSSATLRIDQTRP